MGLYQNIDILGTEYRIIREEFGGRDMDGYCDNTSKEIHIRTDNTNELGNFEELMKVALRHEVIHAFLSESGLRNNWHHEEYYGHDETLIDWFALQYPKVLSAHIQLNCI